MMNIKKKSKLSLQFAVINLFEYKKNNKAKNFTLNLITLILRLIY